MDLVSLLEQQDYTLALINKTFTNFKKAPKVRLTHGYVLIRNETLTEYWNNFQKTHMEIIRLTSKEQKRTMEYFINDIHDQCEEVYLSCKGQLAEILERHNRLFASTSSGRSESAGKPQEINLPKINIPQFTGNYQEWTSFYDLFSSLIHNNMSLNKVQKMHYLKSSLSGDAEQLLKHLSITEANYDVAWNTLQGRYNNKRIIVNSTLGRFVNQKKIVNTSAKSIRDLLDTTVECLNKLETQDIPTKSWDALIIYLTVTKLDPDSHKEWEEEISTLDISELPTFETLRAFLEKRFRVLELIQPNKNLQQQREFIKPKSFHVNTEVKCTYCKQNHTIFQCKEFLKLEEDKRTEYVQNQRLCFNCLIPGHSVKFCKNRASCRRCGKKHHTLLHRINPTNLPPEPPKEEKIPPQIEFNSHLSTSNETTALMSTAVINVTNQRGQTFPLRALLDPCSQESFITERAAQLMGTKKKSVNGQVSGVGQMKTPIKAATEIEISSRTDFNKRMRITAYIVRTVTNVMPTERIKLTNWEHLREINLADPKYYEPGHIDILLGVDVYNEILLPGLIKGVPGSPIAIQTHLGRLLSGRVSVKNERESGDSNIVSMHLNVDLNNMLRKFWELETIDETKETLTTDEKRAEEIYKNTTTRNPDGRFVVHLPLRNDPPIIPSESKKIAVDRYTATEKRLKRNPKLREEYNKVLQEYVDLKHLEKVDPETETGKEKKCVYLPHHAVVKENRETTKVRVVFDASCQGSNGVSLNDELLIGPTLQSELRDIILRWRKNKIAFVADVEKMYRQVRVCTPHTDLQRIVWRPDPLGPIQEYKLLTVTFGTSCAPYLAVKTLRETAVQEGSEHPKAKQAILEDFYMDDLLSGNDNVQEAIEVQKDVTKILKKGGFTLQKWCSNSETFMKEVNEDRAEKTNIVEVQKRESIKTLGLTWEVKKDKLSISNQMTDSNEEYLTKRKVLSEIASLFDPMGWIAPTVVLAKIFMQKLWKCKLSWDEEMSEELKGEWLQFKAELPALKTVSLSRWIYTTKNSKSFELHGFADASASAYAAVIYARVVDEEEQVKISLITAKTKVTPTNPKQIVTLPRLELCAAVLLSKLLKQVAAALQVDYRDIYAWSDSQVVLAWIHGDPMRWTPYVKNRAITITKILEADHWYYVNTKQNPADPASRGIMPTKLQTMDIWWNGPEMLKEKELKLNKGKILDTSLEKRKGIVCNLITEEINEEKEEIHTLLRRYSSFGKLIRVVAYCRRWLLFRKGNKRDDLPGIRLTNEKSNAARMNCIKLSQKAEFSQEIQRLRNHRPLKSKSRLLPLTPFLDEQGLLRVGGRLKNADLEFARKHPIIISKDNVLLPLLLSDVHAKTLHGGPQMMITYLRSNYWLIDATNTVKRFVRKCTICVRQAALQQKQVMGELPKERVKPARPFLKSGVDFAGPVTVLTSRRRGAKVDKAYISVFICMATKAIHLELVSDLTSDAFIAAFKRFVARRGRCSDIWSDQGTNFKGASKELVRMWKESGLNMPDDIVKPLADDGTQWHFIPPYSPNFGGLWEAGVKSVKHHLKRILDTNLTFEEMSTVLTQIEACLNSRPLQPLNGPDLDILEPLTPGHFLVGEALITIPDRDYTDLKINRLSRWQHTQRLVQNFWKRWHTEYLSRLQQRPKWLTRSKEFEIGKVVLVKDENLPPSKWSLARIIEKHPGTDNITRVYTIKCRGKLTKRSVSKLCAFPVDQD